MGVPGSSAIPAIVWDGLRAALDVLSAERDGGGSLRVVDVGGGTGGLAVAVAALGHSVTVVDPSPDALAALERRAAEAAVAARVRGLLGDAGTLPELVEAAYADVVVCHGVLEVVDDPAQALRAAATVLRPGGVLSVLATQQSGAVLARILAGHLDEAAAMLHSDSDAAPRRFARSELEALVVDAGCAVSSVRGVRVFSDHVGSRVLDAQPRAAELLAELDAAVSAGVDFLPLATQLHVLAQRPAHS